MPTPRRALGVAQHGGELYAAGGWNGESTQLAVVEIYEPPGRTWRTGPPLAAARSQHGLVSTAGGLWAVGGWSAEGGLVSAVEVLEAAQGPWRTVTHLPTPRREPGVAVFAGEIVVAGGFDGWSDAEQDGYLTRVEAYDPLRDRWRRLASLTHPRRGLSLVAAGGALYAIGGYGPDAPGFSAAVERYDPAAGRWETLAWPIAARTWAAAVTVEEGEGADGKAAAIIVAGGFNQAGVLDLVERIDPASGAVCHPPPLAAGRAWAGAAGMPGGIMVAGGETAAGFSAALVQAPAKCTR